MPKIAWNGVCNRTPLDISRSTEYSRGLWLPWLSPPEGANKVPLAIVGGGPSIREHIEELLDWPGDIWAINGVFRWLKDKGRTPTYFTIDPETFQHTPTPSFVSIGQGDNCILATRVPGVIFDHCIAVGADARLFEMSGGHVTASTWALRLSAILKRSDVTFFGCESSYREGEPSHAYENCEVRDLIMVRSDGKDFLTKPELVEQAWYLGLMIKNFPHVYRERSGGLLAAMVAEGDYDITKVPRWMMDNLTLVDDGVTSRLWKQSGQKALAWGRKRLEALSHLGYRPKVQS